LFKACILGGDVYLFGGFQLKEEEVSILNDLWKFEIASSKWILLASECPAPERGGHVVVAVSNNEMIIHGGDCMKSLDDFWLFNRTARNSSVAT
jgi:N-acetylneuraminic acid mutarotase